MTNISPEFLLSQVLKLPPKPCLTFLIGKTRDNTRDVLLTLLSDHSWGTGHTGVSDASWQYPMTPTCHVTTGHRTRLRKLYTSSSGSGLPTLCQSHKNTFLFCKICLSTLRNTQRNKQLKKSFHKSYFKNESIKEDTRKHLKNVVLMHSFHEIRQLFLF